MVLREGRGNRPLSQQRQPVRWLRKLTHVTLGCMVSLTQTLAVAQETPPQSASPVPASPAASTPSSANDGSAKDAAAPADLSAAPLALALALEQATTAAIEKAEQSVVAIARVRRDQAPRVRADQLQVPGPLPTIESPENPDFIPSEFASGVIISRDGYIVTCAHAIDDVTRYEYYVYLDRRAYSANVVARSAKVQASDPYTDLAVLKIDAQDLTPITFGTADQLRKGSFVISLGNPYATARDGNASASWGIVANLKRTPPLTNQSNENGLLAKESQHQFGTLIQTDARLNLGTSGGALVNLRGEMVGLTTSLAALSGFEQSAGYAIAVDDMFKRVVDALKTGHQPEFGFLGIQPEELRASERAAGLAGARVNLVLPGLPGDLAGLHNDDRITEVNRKPIEDRNGLFRELGQLPAGADIDLTVVRPGRGDARSTLHLKATLSKRYVATSRPAYAIHGPQPWRGMMVEYLTALPTELTRGAFPARRSGVKLAVISVDPDSSAWKAGVRAGHMVLAIGGVRLNSPDEFYARAEKISGTAQVQLYRGTDRLETIAITPQ